jgi:gamma-glutamyl:cysteine ligase YbdK (ATP-grasp superfamily)
MGQEIDSTEFSEADFVEFRRRLKRETQILESWFDDGVFSDRGGVGGFELEAWLLDRNGYPAPENEAFIEAADSSLVVPELAKFNVELNAAPHRLGDGSLTRMHAELLATWQRCLVLADELGIEMATIGILPTVRPGDLTPVNMSPMRRYRALNEQIFRVRKGRPIHLRVDGPESIDLLHQDVMLEAAATSFQIHLKVSPDESVALYNASKVLSAPLVAVTANSPFLFGHELWEETRIPLFEQAVSVGGSEFDRRVGFGRGFLETSMMQCFQVNLEHFPVLLPRLCDAKEEEVAHLRFHNGTIWRWNRPLVGFDQDGTPHLRIEQRVIPAGPTVMDMIANAALYFGAVRALAAELGVATESRLPFLAARENFYRAAREGLSARLTWLDGESGDARDLVLERVLPLAEIGLSKYGIKEAERHRWLDIVRRRVETGRNGAWWQRAWVASNGPDPVALTRAYLKRQQTDIPVHQWDISSNND